MERGDNFSNGKRQECRRNRKGTMMLDKKTLGFGEKGKVTGGKGEKIYEKERLWPKGN